MLHTLKRTSDFNISIPDLKFVELYAKMSAMTTTITSVFEPHTLMYFCASVLRDACTPATTAFVFKHSYVPSHAHGEMPMVTVTGVADAAPKLATGAHCLHLLLQVFTALYGVAYASR
jgi:hypothetical protein